MFYLVFIFGMIVGSFLNVVIYRLNPTLQLKGGVFGRSMCPNCKTQLKWYDLIPLFSFICLCGRCRHCRKKISWQYPMVEILSGLIWILVFSKNLDNFQFTIFNLQSISNLQFLNQLNLLNFFYHVLIFSTLLVIAVYDFKWKIIPDKIVYPAIIVVFLYNIFNSLKYFNFKTFKLLNFEILKYINIEIFIYPLLAAIIAFFLFFLIYFFSNGRAMGLGDAKLAFLIGLFLDPSSTATALISAFIIGAIFGIILLALGTKTFKSQIAFGPFLVLGVFIAFFFSEFVINSLNF
ncbi:hypothetical protein A2819_00965 [Candidatus Azambacteria bacterium RIFCSPHIGHO2_01_FULL_40_24]|uniref:Peptidase A24A N-terminal domain-containing protein n=1 Tax=Candidatus Azambacteria bacterium RIFCSPHIGHO2_01_FULL_40_24 TaxID=1797301 RepID=A0A1F5B2E6_9BACT|nr:MAG: hypothetical protein A2819_00965 [Candidatus Azambacteria bacterium RIFCSPHIGHO2_01_FULL_40_24]